MPLLHYLPITQSSVIESCSRFRSSLGRARAWLRLALMQKRLADYFKALVERRDTLLRLTFDPLHLSFNYTTVTLIQPVFSSARSYYEEGAAMLDEESHVIGGILVGLNVIDCSFNIKDANLDGEV